MKKSDIRRIIKEEIQKLNELKVTSYEVEDKIDEPTCSVCGKKIKVGETSFEYRPERGEKLTKEKIGMTWCKKDLPKGAKVYKGTQLN